MNTISNTYSSGSAKFIGHITDPEISSARRLLEFNVFQEYIMGHTEKTYPATFYWGKLACAKYGVRPEVDEAVVAEGANFTTAPLIHPENEIGISLPSFACLSVYKKYLSRTGKSHYFIESKRSERVDLFALSSFLVAVANKMDDDVIQEGKTMRSVQAKDLKNKIFTPSIGARGLVYLSGFCLSQIDGDSRSFVTPDDMENAVKIFHQLEEN